MERTLSGLDPQSAAHHTLRLVWDGARAGRAGSTIFRAPHIAAGLGWSARLAGLDPQSAAHHTLRQAWDGARARQAGFGNERRRTVQPLYIPVTYLNLPDDATGRDADPQDGSTAPRPATLCNPEPRTLNPSDPPALYTNATCMKNESRRSAVQAPPQQPTLATPFNHQQAEDTTPTP
eukprot:360976-Chlamydomonas_euryale.AAC.6